MNVKCPICGKVISVDDALAGKRGTCPFCKQVFSVPGSAPGAPPVSPASAKTPPPEPRPAGRAAPRASMRPAGTNPKMSAPGPAAPRLGILEQPAPTPVSLQTAARAMPAAAEYRPPTTGPALWQQPGLYGAASLGFGIAAFPVATVFASEYTGLGLAGLGALLGLVGLLIFLLYRRAAAVLPFVGLVLGGAVAFGLWQDIKRMELARQASSVAETLAQAELTLAEVEKNKKEAEKLATEAKTKLEKAKKESEEGNQKFQEGEKALKQSLQEKKTAAGLLDQAQQKENELKTKEKDLQKQIDTLKEQQLLSEKAKQEAEEAQVKLKKDKEETDKKLVEIQDLLEEKKAVEKKAEEAIKLLMSKLKDRDPNLRLKATQGIAVLGSDAPPEAAVALCEATVSGDNPLKQAAFLALHKVRPDLYVPVVTLAKSTKFNQDGVNVEVFTTAKKLGEMGKSAAPTAPIFTTHLNAFLELKDPREADLETARFLAEALGKISPDVAAVELLGKIARYRIDDLKETDAPLRHAGRAALFDIGKEQADRRKQIVPLLTAGLKEEIADQRKQICDWLAAYGPDAKSAIPELMKLLADSEVMVNEAADRALKEIQKGKDGLEK